MNTKLITVQGTAAEHVIEVRPLARFNSVDEMMAAFNRSDVCGKVHWNPENGSDFKTVGAATGWLKKLLKKAGWPNPTRWVVYSTAAQHEGEERFSVSVCHLK